MSGQIGFWDVQHRLSQLSRHGDPLEKLSVTVDFEIKLRNPIPDWWSRRTTPASGRFGLPSSGAK